MPPKQNKCQACLKIFHSVVHLKRHEMVGCCVYTEYECYTPSCPDCYISFSSYDDAYSLDMLAMHKRNCEYKTGIEPCIFQCSICKKSFLNQDLSNTSTSSTNNTSYNSCDTSNLEDQIDHKRFQSHCLNFEYKCGLVLDSEIESLKCHFCHETFKDIKYLVKHIVEDYETCFNTSPINTFVVKNAAKKRKRKIY